MATEVPADQRDTQPYSNIGVIEAIFPDGSTSQGTCSLIGRNDILTATHVVYDPERGGWADSYNFYFGADYNNIYDNFEDYGYLYSPDRWTTNAYPDQTFTDSDNDTMLQSEAQYDISIIGVNSPIGDTLGWLGLEGGYDYSASANAVGYPSGEPGMMQETVSVQQNSFYHLYESAYNVLGKGSSGGPLLVGNFVIGVKSTATWWADIGFVFDNLSAIMDENNSLLPTPPDTTAPMVALFSPADGSSEVDVTDNIVLVFSEAIQRGTGNIVLKTAVDAIVATYNAAISTNLSIAGDTLTINPTADLSRGTQYKVEFAAGTIKDLAGNSFAGTTSYNFTTASPLNNSPTLAQPIVDQEAAVDAPFTFTVPAGTFSDLDGDMLIFTTNLAGGDSLPMWLSFHAATRDFSGTPDNGDVGTFDIRVTATDPQGASVFDNFLLTVKAFGAASPGTNNSETLTGTSGDDIFNGLAGDDTINGGTGNDTAQFSGAAKDYLVFADRDGHYIVNDLDPADGDDGRDILNDMEFLKFTTGTQPIADAISELKIIDDDPYYWDSRIGLPNGEIVPVAEAQLFRTYFGAMQRTPDDGGFAWWLDEIEQGRHDLRSMAAGFIWSEEFLGYVEAPDGNSIPNDDFLTHMYQGAFGRDPDGEGYNWWLNELDSGGRSQTDVLVDMTQSNEYVEITLLGVADYLY